ncbi:MAG: hypothetical protein F9K30_22955 [Dechloromonas sp.]|nr:MAG: hypothetical protein F9K30_22955 [Dechloromonas sp.]
MDDMAEMNEAVVASMLIGAALGQVLVARGIVGADEIIARLRFLGRDREVDTLKPALAEAIRIVSGWR